MDVSNLSQETKALLIKALISEAKDLPEINGFGESNYLEQYPHAIEYVKSGNYNPKSPQEWDIFWALVEDLKTFLTDYDLLHE